jgi:iron(III) transport system permease protein
VNSWSVSAVALIVFLVIPVAALLFSGLDTPTEVWDHVSQTLLPRYLSNTFYISFFIGLFSVILGFVPAWFVVMYDFPLRRSLEWMLILPLSIPSYILGFTYVGILDFTGPVQSFLRNFAGIDAGQFIDIMNIEGVIFVMSFALYPYIYIITRSTLAGQSASMLESSRLLGKSAYKTFFRLAIPLSRPAIIAGLFLVLMEVLNDYGTVKYYGVDTFTTGIFRAWYALGDPHTAIKLSLILMVFVIVLVALERIQRGKARFDGSATGKPIAKKPLTSSKKWFVSAVCITPVLFGFIIPVIQLIAWMFKTYSTALDQQFWSMVANSFLLALTASILAVLIAVLLIFSTRINNNNFMKMLAKSSTFGYAIPGAVIAVGVLMTFSYTDNWTGSFMILSGSLFGLVYAYLVRFLAVAYNPVQSGFEQQCKNTDQAARTLGISSFKTLLKVNLPIAKTSVFSAVILVFIDILKELPLTLILRPFNFNTLATRAFELASNEMVAEASTSALIIILTGLIPILFLNRLMGYRS